MKYSEYQKTCNRCKNFAWHKKYVSVTKHTKQGVKHKTTMTVVQCSICDSIVLFTIQDEQEGCNYLSKNGY